MINPQWLELPLFLNDVFQFLDIFLPSLHTSVTWNEMICKLQLSQNVRKRTHWHMRPEMIQIGLRMFDCQRRKVSSRGQRWLIRLRGCADWFESSFGAFIRRYVFSRCGSNEFNAYKGKLIHASAPVFVHKIKQSLTSSLCYSHNRALSVLSL